MSENFRNFVVGESVVCILNNRATLTVGKEYLVVSIDSDDDSDVDFTVEVKTDGRHTHSYHNSRFMTKSDFREHLIDNILK